MVDKGEFRVASIQDDIHPAAGDYFFTARLAGDFTDGIDQMSQRVYLDKFVLRQGYYTATLNFKSNGWGDGDYGVVTLHAMDCMGKTLDSQHVRTLGKHKIWLDNTVSLALPVDTHSLLLEVQAVRVTGATSDVHFNDFRLTIDQNLPTQLQNPSAETGDLTGWRLQKGEFRVVEEQDGILPLTGKYFITARLKGTFADDHDQMSQEIAVAPRVDLNQDVIARLQFASSGFGDGEYGMVRLIAKNHHGHSLTSKLITTKGTKQRWLDYVIALPLTPDTASLVLEVNAFRISGSTSDVHFSDFTLAFISSTLTFGD
ncbi:hypothetical protein NVIRENTERO_02441 [Sodalis praecaptivus]|nr:hypothetical protein NVIRENTERO_02441 [Sodalis praecaptivus]